MLINIICLISIKCYRVLAWNITSHLYIIGTSLRTAHCVFIISDRYKCVYSQCWPLIHKARFIIKCAISIDELLFLLSPLLCLQVYIHIWHVLLLPSSWFKVSNLKVGIFLCYLELLSNRDMFWGNRNCTKTLITWIELHAFLNTAYVNKTKVSSWDIKSSVVGICCPYKPVEILCEYWKRCLQPHQFSFLQRSGSINCTVTWA